MDLKRQHSFIGSWGWFLLAVILAPAIVLFAKGDETDQQKSQMEASDTYVSPTNGLGSWIWSEKTTNDQTCQFWNKFEVPKDGKVAKAQLVMTADNEFTLYLDGRELGRGVEWRELYVFNLAPLLKPGRHILAIQCYNGAFFAGMLLGLRVDLTDGRKIEVKSDTSWKVVPNATSRWKKLAETESDWPPAVVIASLGSKPW